MPDPPIVLSMDTTVADALLWFLGKLAVWTVRDVIGWAAVLVVFLVIQEVVFWWFRKTID